MAYLQDYVFLDSNSTVTTSEPLTVNSKAETLKLSVTGTGTLAVTVEGKVSSLTSSFYSIGAIKLEDNTVVSEITAEGIYAVDVQGIAQVRIVNGGSAGDVTVIGVVAGR